MHRELFPWFLIWLGALVLISCDDEPLESDPPDEAVVASAVVSDVIPTVVTITGTAQDPAAILHLDYGLDGALDQRRDAEIDADGAFEILVLGLRPSRDYDWQIAGETSDGESLATEVATLTTGPVPSSFPSLDVSSVDAERAIQGFLVTSLIADVSVPVVIDTSGEYVWWHAGTEEGVTICRARLSRDGESVLYLGYARIDLGAEIVDGQTLVRVSLDGTDEQVTTTTGGGRDFYEMADGTIAMLTFDIRPMDDHDLNGDVIVEIAPDGSTTEVFNIWDHLDEIPEVASGPGLCHANHLEYDEERGVYHMSCRGLAAILVIDRASGDILSQIGGQYSDYETPDGSTELFRDQHGFQVLDDGVLVFDNEGPPEMNSNVRQYRLWDETGVAEEVWHYQTDPPVFVYVLGDASKLPNGDNLVTWTTAGQIEQVTEAQDVVWRLNSGFGAGFGYTTFREDLYVAD